MASEPDDFNPIDPASDPPSVKTADTSEHQPLVESEPAGGWVQNWQRRGSAAQSRVMTFLQQRKTQVSGWFRVNEAEIAEILAKIRTQLPTTEVILIGKPQAGKSSITRGITGVSAEIVGQGFRPHTTHTQRYDYPTGNLPLLIFTDTVGLGESNEGIQQITQTLLGELEPAKEATTIAAAKILILTIRINDFATDSLAQVVTHLRQQHPEIPCLLAVTCLHEVYPVDAVDHPVYPPEYEDVSRAFRELQARLQGLYDQAVLVDFTLEEDSYTPVFYGLEALVEAIAGLLPEAEAKVMHLMTKAEVGSEIGNFYREAGRRYITPFAIMAGTLAAVPIPFATMPVLTALQVTLVGLLGQLYGQVLSPSQAGGVASAIAGGFMAQVIGRELVKFIPGFGSVIAASWAAAYTWALGEAACVYFGDLMGGKQPDPKQIQQVMDEAFKAAQTRFKQSIWTSGPERSDL